MCCARLRLSTAIFLTVIGIYAQTGPAGQEAWQRALQLHQSGDLAGAIEAYRECLAADPTRFDAQSNLGAVLAASGRYSEAVEQYRKALALAPPQFASRVRENLGLAYYKSGQFEDAIAVLSEVRRADGADLKTDLLLADSYLQNGEPGKAADLLSIYETTKPDDKAVAYVLGTALIRSGQVDRGQRVIDVILRDGDSAEARFLIGATMLAAQDFPGAVKQFSSALALDATIPSLHSWYGQALLATGDADGAAAAFHEELLKNPNDFDSNLHLGEILRARKAFVEAFPLLDKAVTERPRSREARLEMAGLQVDLHRYKEALPPLLKLIEEQPGAPAAHVLIAAAYEGVGEAKQAASQRTIAAELRTQVQESAGPVPGDLAPDFTLPELGSGKPRRLNKPAVLLFGSYTCPNFRQQAPAINALAEKLGTKIPFLLVYIREAHTGDTWQSTINERQGIDWQPAKTMPEMQDHAQSCVRKLKMNFPAVVDSLDGEVESQYAAWPSRLYVIGKTGRVVYSTRLSELDFHPAEVEAAVRSAF